MIKVAGIDHIVISVRDFKKSREFYKKLLGFLGFRVMYSDKYAVGWSNKITRYWIVIIDPKYKKVFHKKGMVGFHHSAFALSKKKDVDELYKFLVKNKVPILDPPAEYPQYGRGYYAVFFKDPDGLKLEGMHFPR